MSVSRAARMVAGVISTTLTGARCCNASASVDASGVDPVT